MGWGVLLDMRVPDLPDNVTGNRRWWVQAVQSRVTLVPSAR
ncbi:MAG: hypothetical protein AB1609_15195 [Bacillota bacterium]